jgi:hypothetical protein
MYRIKARNDQTEVIFYEYGFTNYMMKRLHFMFNETDNQHYSIYNILEITKIVFTPKTFIKCLTNYTKVV